MTLRFNQETVTAMAQELSGSLVIGALLSGEEPVEHFESLISEDREGYTTAASEEYARREQIEPSEVPHTVPDAIADEVRRQFNGLDNEDEAPVAV